MFHTKRNKMMRKLLIWGVLLCSTGIYAQGDADSTRMLKDPFYLQLYLGVNKSANENLPWTEFTAYPLSYGAFIGVGSEWSRLWGWRAALRFNHNKSRNVQECEEKDTWGWNNTGLFADVTFDVSDLLRKNKVRSKRPKFNVKAFVGIGAAYTWQFDKVPLSYTHPYSRSSKIVPGARAGVTATMQIARKWRLGAEVSHNLYEDHFNGVAYESPIDMRTNLKIGLTYLFVKKAKKPAPDVIRKKRLKECPLIPLVIPEPEEVKQRQILGRAFLDFPVNEMMIYPSYRKNPSELARIQATVDSALFDRTINVTQISLHGYASPESPYSNNTRLAKGRTESLMNYLIKKYSFDQKLFKNDYTPEDWDNLRGFLTNMQGRRVKGDYWYDNQAYVETPEVPSFVLEYRDELLQVIDSNMEADAKEEVLKQVARGEPYRWLLKYVYPGLRHTDYIIEYEVKHYPVEVSRRLIYNHPEALSLEEMYLVAMSYEEGSDGWSDALYIAARQFPNDETANLNAAYASIRTRHLKDAKQYLSKAGHSSQAIYLTDIILAMEGEVKWKMERGKLIVED